MTHCTTADKLVIPNFSLAGSVLSRNGGLATFVHEQLEWSLVDQSPEQSEIEWLCVDVAGYKFINVYKPPRSRYAPTAIPTFLVCMLATSTANMSTEVKTKHLLTVRVWTPGQHPTTLVCYIIIIMAHPIVDYELGACPFFLRSLWLTMNNQNSERHAICCDRQQVFPVTVERCGSPPCHA